MIISRVLSIFLRFAEFVCAAVVLGLTAYFLDKHEHGSGGPFGRLIYSIIIASISVLFSLFWLIPTVSSMLHYPFDFIMSAAWFALFGILVNYLDGSCGGTFEWGGIRFRNNYCGQWKAMQAFSFLSAIFWFVSFLLGIWVVHKVRRDPVAVDGGHRRSRWHSRSRV